MIRFSATKLNTYKMCPFRYFLHYIKKFPQPSMSALQFGIAVHKILEDFQNWAKAHPTPSEFEEKLRDITNQRFNTISNQVMYDIGITKPYIFEVYLQDYMNYFLEHRLFEKKYETEKSINLNINDIRLTGKIDVYFPPDIIVDFKTSKYIPTVSKLIEAFQTRIYSLATEKEATMIYIYLRKPMKIKSVKIGTSNNQIKQEIYQFAKMIQNTTNFSKKYDSCNLCPYKQECRSDQISPQGELFPPSTSTLPKDTYK